MINGMIYISKYTSLK